MTRGQLVSRRGEAGARTSRRRCRWRWIVFALGDRPGRRRPGEVHPARDRDSPCWCTLFLTLAVTPLRRLTGWNELIRVRRLDRAHRLLVRAAPLPLPTSCSTSRCRVPDIMEDVVKHPWVLVGFASFLMLVPLAVTSTNGWIRRLGGRRWRRLHRLIYPGRRGRRAPLPLAGQEGRADAALVRGRAGRAPGRADLGGVGDGGTTRERGPGRRAGRGCGAGRGVMVRGCGHHDWSSPE